MQLSRLVGSVVVLTGLCSLVAGTASALPQARKLDPKIGRAIATGIQSPWQASHGRNPIGSASVIIELNQAATPASLARLSATGARLSSVGGRPLAYGRLVPSMVDPHALGALAALAEVVSVSLAPALGPPPLDNSAKLIGLEAARGASAALDTLTGQGIVVADLDANADIFHPQFFRADAGYFDWIDVNHDGQFVPGVDAIDLNRNGIGEASETAREIRVTTWDGSATEVPARPNSFDPGIDWLYLDQNANGERDYGSAAGFDDTAPALGEPLFVPDDVNLDHKLSVGERVIRLGTSKFRSVYVHVTYGTDIDKVYQRGVDLSQHTNEYSGGQYGYSDALHGTGVLSILAGDVPLVGRRWVGIAPDAELVLAFEMAQEFKSMPWALQQKPHVMLHETAAWTGLALDGSDSYSSLVDSSTLGDKVSHTCPVGNTAGSRKHLHKVLAAATSSTLSFNVPNASASYIQVSLNVRGAGPISFKLVEPNGTEHVVDSDPWVLSTGAYGWPTIETTIRNTHFTDVILYVNDPASELIAQGDWKVVTSGDPSTAATLDAYLSDDQSGWGTGVAWPLNEATDDRTIGVPATSDSCIAIGAHTGHAPNAQQPWYPDAEGPGEVKAYSGRGPRIDGVSKPDIAAPDNPWAAAPTGDMFLMGYMVPYGTVWPFSGTSGAGPHVTGVTALLAQAGIRGDQARDAIRAGAIHDGVTGSTPNSDYGYGRLSAAGAFGVNAEGSKPVVSLQAVPAVVTVGQQVMLQPQASDADGPASALEAKWDDGYDGTWDSPYAPVAPRTVTMSKSGAFSFKVRVRDAEGRVAEAVARMDVTESSEPGAEAGPEPGPEAGHEAGPEPKLEAGADTGHSTGADGSHDSSLLADGPDGSGKDASPPAKTTPVDQATLEGGGCNCRMGRANSPAYLLTAVAGLLLVLRRRRLR